MFFLNKIDCSSGKRQYKIICVLFCFIFVWLPLQNKVGGINIDRFLKEKTYKII